MQYIEKLNWEPTDWNVWFTVTIDGRAPFRTWNFRERQGFPDGEIDLVKQCLIDEQNALCAYCQKRIDLKNSSVDHLLPHSLNSIFSTNYHNLVAVCKDSSVIEGKAHCDTVKKSTPHPHLIFWNNALAGETKSHPYFLTIPYTGQVLAKDQNEINLKIQIDSFIEILNLDHQHLRDERKEYFDPLYKNFVKMGRTQGINYCRLQIKEILNKPSQPFRQFLLISLHQLIGTR